MRKLRRLIINADDFGISRGVNDGIVEAARVGGITSTSLLVSLPDSADAVTRIRHCPGISVGLHFNLTVGNALTGSSSLTYADSAEFFPLPKLLAAASLGMLDDGDIERECLAQIDRMTRAGLPPTHFDSHRHIHTHPAVYPAVLRAVRARCIPHLRVPCEPLDRNVGVFGATVKKSLLLLSARRSRRLRLGETGSDRPGMNITGWISFIMQEPLSGEKMWIKKLELDPVKVEGVEIYEANAQYRADGCGGQALVGYNPTAKKLYIGQTEAMASALKKMYPVILSQFEKYLDSEEMVQLKAKGQEIRALKVY